jgi:hypothetical protein
MKRFVFFLSFIFTTSICTLVPKMAARLSNFNRANGFQCRVIICDSELYHDGEYKDVVLISNSKGDDISSKERCLNYSIGDYNAT